MMIKFFSDILDLLLPRFCVCCDERLSSDEHQICNKCLQTMPRVSKLDAKGDHVERMFWGRVPLVNAQSLYIFDGDLVPRAVHKFKYSNKPQVAIEMGRIMTREFMPSGFFSGIDAIIPVPLHKNRQASRGYNQTDYIAQGISELTGIPVWNDVVKRIVDNPTQTHMDRQARNKNVQDVFLCTHPERLIGKHILVVDDVITTGATTVSLCTAILKALGEDTDKPQIAENSPVRFSIASIAYSWHHIAL